MPREFDPTRRLEIEQTERLARLASTWAFAPRPARIPVPEPHQESVWSYPRPPSIEEVAHRGQVFVGEECVADSERCLRVLETASAPTIYFAPGDVREAALIEEDTTSYCEWKGVATYFSICTEIELAHSAAWSYASPYHEYAALTGYYSFYPGRGTRCVYGGQIVRPQPGGFYGGWITDNLLGPFKGEPGSEGW